MNDPTLVRDLADWLRDLSRWTAEHRAGICGCPRVDHDRQHAALMGRKERLLVRCEAVEAAERTSA